MKAKNKMPAILFYTGDWLKDPAVRCASLDARGLWIDMLCLMYESPVRGYLSLANGKGVTGVQLARMVGSNEEQVLTLLEELKSCGVFSVDENDVMFSRRMVADEELRELKSKAGKASAKSKEIAKFQHNVNTTSTEVQHNANTMVNTTSTALEYETETETDSSSSINNNNTLEENAKSDDSPQNFLAQRKVREIILPDEITIVLNAIPQNRITNPVLTKKAIADAIDRAVGVSAESKVRLQAGQVLAQRCSLYYDSDEGNREYFKAPHNWLDQDCHLADPSSWESRKKQKPTSGWETIL